MGKKDVGSGAWDAAESCQSLQITEEQRAAAERLRSYIVREGLVSVMNDSKWRRLQNAMENLSPRMPRFRLKCLRDSEPAEERWEYDWGTSLPTFAAIEWVEIDPMHHDPPGGRLLRAKAWDRTEELERLLRSSAVPFEVEGGRIRVYGYRRPSPR